MLLNANLRGGSFYWTIKIRAYASRPSKNTRHIQLLLSGSFATETDDECYLGVTVTTLLKTRAHINKICAFKWGMVEATLQPVLQLSSCCTLRVYAQD